uniref:NAC transcription factor 31 n=1 Tax=Litchi chinensis TaxID=151069 RepID=A0A8K1HZD3_LITCN|nr:NAC transcription factor 31 [Litchi chinensis]
MSGPTLPPGFRFHPTDQELIIHYLRKKVSSSSPNQVDSIIAEVNIYKFDPWELPDKARFGESEWFFFSPRDRKYPNGTRPNRAAASGYWKATGTDKPILSSTGGSQYCLGVKKALVFYQGRPPKGTKTNWMMLEYKLIGDTFRSQRPLRASSMRLDDWVLCRVRQKSRTPQRIKHHDYIASICNSVISPSPFASGCLQGQDHLVKDNINILESSIDEFQAYLMAPSEIIEEADDHDRGEANSDHHHHIDSSQAMSVSSNELEALERLRKALSIGALDELVPSTACDYNYEDKESIFQVSSPATSASTSPYFPQFMI